MAYEKRFKVRRMRPVEADPYAWREHLLRDFPGTELFVVERRPVAAERLDLERCMPELLPGFDALTAAMGDVDWAPGALTMHNLRPFFSGCSVAVSRRDGRATLLRNYDLGPNETSGVLRVEELAGGGWILGAGEAGWGYMDGLNDRGLAAAITFGGRFTVGDGFAVPVLVRYLLQTCATVAEAEGALHRLPHRLTQNFALLDRSGESAVVFTSPDQGVLLAAEGACVTNHQGQVADPGHARFVRTAERLEYLQQAGGALTLQDFLRPPLYQTQYAERFGTLYTVEFDPGAGTARYAWPDQELTLDAATQGGELTVIYRS